MGGGRRRRGADPVPWGTAVRGGCLSPPRGKQRPEDRVGPRPKGGGGRSEGGEGAYPLRRGRRPVDRSGPRPMGGGGRRGCLSPPRGTTCLTGVAGGPGGSSVRRLCLLGGGVLLALLPGSPDGLRKRTGGPLTELVGRGHHSPLHQSPVFGFGGPETLVERPNDSGQRRKGTGARSAWIGGNSRRQDVLLACAIKRHRDVDGGLNAVEPVRVSIVRQRGYGGSDSRLGGRLVGRDPRPSGKRHQGDFRSRTTVSDVRRPREPSRGPATYNGTQPDFPRAHPSQEVARLP